MTEPKTETERAETLVEEILLLIEEKKGRGTVVLDLSDAPLGIDLFVVTEAENPKQLRAIAQHLEENLSREPYAVEGRDSRVWAVLDYGDVVVHIFQREARRFYDLEGLWGEGEPDTPE